MLILILTALTLLNTILIFLSFLIFYHSSPLLLSLLELEKKKEKPQRILPKFTSFKDLPARIGDALYLGGFRTKEQVLATSNDELTKLGFTPGEIVKIREDLS